MRNVSKIISYIVLSLMIVVSGLVFSGNISIEINKVLMLILTIAWFLTASVWMLNTQDKQ